MMPLTKVTDMSFQRSTLGRILGYGEFILESAGRTRRCATSIHLPYPGAALPRGVRADLQGQRGKPGLGG
jgi:hypothetical protein